MKEGVNRKVEEIQLEMSKEVVKLDQNYSNLHTKVDVIADAVTKVLESFNSLCTKVDSKLESDSKVFAKLEELLRSLKESLSKLEVSPSSSISQEFLSNFVFFIRS